MSKSLLLVLLAPFSVAFGTDPDVQKALDDALKLYPPGDYENFIPQIAPPVIDFRVRTLKKAERIDPELGGSSPSLLRSINCEAKSLNQTVREPLAPLTDNPFDRPIKLFGAPTSSAPVRGTLL